MSDTGYDLSRSTGRLQRGIAFQQGHRPASCFRLLLLNATSAATPRAVHDGVLAIDRMLQRLAAGEVRELAGQPADKAQASAELFAGLEHLVSFGRRLFDADAHDPVLVAAPRPDHLVYLAPDGPFPTLRWEHEGAVNRGEADIALQFTAERQAAVNCAAVEVWKLVADEAIPLEPVASFDGFGRHDGRGWLEFHDGVSNMHSSQRRAALEAPPDPEWMAGGTYMAFLRLNVDLAVWRTLSRPEQELLVGRDKLSGAPLVGSGSDDSGVTVPIAAAAPDEDADDRAVSDFIDPPQTTDSVVEASHVHRANQVRGSPAASAALRMFRQGYEFLEDVNGRPRLGLNFVSFQRDLAILHHVLHLPGWLGDVNFGGPKDPGPGEPHPVRFITVSAGGLYAVPPVGIPFPGTEAFGGARREN